MSQSKPTFTHEQLHEALLTAQDYLERSMVPFVLLDDTAKQMLNELPNLHLSEISIGVMKRYWTQSCSSIFKSLVPKSEMSQDLVSYEHGKVPVLIWIIHREFDVFRYPDSRFYYQTEFMLPNPFDKYWKKRHLIK